MGSYGHCLYRRPSGIYAVRICVPKALQAAIGRRELHLSTGSATRSDALSVASAVQGRWRQCFEDLQTLNDFAVLNGVPELAGPAEQFVPLSRVAELFEVSPVDVVSTLSGTGAFGAIQLVAVEGVLVPESCRQRVETWEDVHRFGSEHAYTGPAVLASWESLGPALLSGESVCADEFYIPEGKLYSLQKQQFGIEALWARLRDVEKVRLTWAVAVGVRRSAREFRPTSKPIVNSISSLTLAPSTGQSTRSSKESSSAARTAGKLISTLVDEYLTINSTFAPPSDRAKWKPDEARKHRTRLKLFVDILGDPSIDVFSDRKRGETAIANFVNGLAGIPTNQHLRLAMRELGPDAQVDALTAWAKQRPEVIRMQPGTTKSYLNTVSEFFAWAIERNYFASNFAKQSATSIRRKKKEIDREKTELFSDEELRLIFSASWFAKGTLRTASGKLDVNWRPYRYWMPLMGIYMGGRPRELSQLMVADFVIKDGIQCIDINEESDRQSLKNINAKRITPIPQTLLELGLLSYVEELRNAGQTQLFPELPYDEEKGCSKYVGRWFNEEYLGKRLKVKRGAGKNLYSLRHHFATSLKRSGCPHHILVELMGHERGAGVANSTYIKGALKSDLEAAVNQVQYDLPPIAPFNSKDGLQGVKAALGRKR